MVNLRVCVVYFPSMAAWAQGEPGTTILLTLIWTCSDWDMITLTRLGPEVKTTQNKTNHLVERDRLKKRQMSLFNLVSTQNSIKKGSWKKAKIVSNSWAFGCTCSINKPTNFRSLQKTKKVHKIVWFFNAFDLKIDTSIQSVAFAIIINHGATRAHLGRWPGAETLHRTNLKGFYNRFNATWRGIAT